MPQKTRSLRGSLEALLPGEVDDPQGYLLSVARDLLAGIDTPVSLGLEIRLKYGELEQAVRKRVNPLDYNDPLSFGLDYQAVSFLSKAPLKIPGVDPRAVALESFLESEEACRQTNHRIRNYRDSPYIIGPSMHSILHGATKIISSILGVVDPFELLSKSRFGPGGDSSTLGNRTSAYDKLLTTPEATRDAVPLTCMLVNEVHGLQCAFGLDPYFGPQRKFSEKDLKHVKGNRITFVPKNAVTHRTIAIEPHMNIFLQLGVGAILRRKLKRRGLDLDSQEGNQILARKGSLYGELCTIDLSSASDPLSRELVRELLPEPWFNLMDVIRSKVGLLRDGVEQTVIRYEKFSSMGNGFTFELESLIFWALAKSVTEFLGESLRDLDGNPRVRVYGDDIVCPTAVFPCLVDVLAWCGFQVNSLKSFSSGMFRESCGKDYFAGTLVRPFFQKELPNDVQTLFRMANGIRRAAYRSAAYNGCDNRFRLAWCHAIRGLPRPYRGFFQPSHKGVIRYETLGSLYTLFYSGINDDLGRDRNATEGGVEVSRDGFWPVARSSQKTEFWEEIPSAESNQLKGFCPTDDSLALIGNLDEAMGHRPYRFKFDKDYLRQTHITMAVRAEPRRFTWDSSRRNVFGVLLYETRNGREVGLGSQSFNRGSGNQHVVWLHWEQWRDMGPWV